MLIKRKESHLLLFENQLNKKHDIMKARTDILQKSIAEYNDEKIIFPPAYRGLNYKMRL